MFSTNAKSTFFFIKEALPLLKNAPMGKNILLISSNGAITPFPFIGVYNMTKAMQVNMTRFLADEFIGLGIRVNCLAPGVVLTELATNTFTEE
jgi:NAD(P)-dependent dehydrogenase (short-subunit alcohol dehydrogenase family)